jgi:4-amino-4-deoxy-L-arabinose transferase-like glycosyltransferase
MHRWTLLRWAGSPAGIFLVALAARVAWILTLPDHLIWIDEKQFAEIARSIAAGDGYIASSYRANPVVPAYLAAFFRALGESVLYPRLGQAVIGALSCVLLQRLGTVVADKTVGTIAAWLVVLYPGHIYLSGVFYADCIAVALATGWLLLTYRTMAARRPTVTALAAGVLFGLLALTRPTFLATAPLAVGFFFLLPGARFARALRTAAAFTVACVLTIAPWTIANYRAYGHIVVVSGGFWDTLWKGNNELADGGPDDRLLSWDSQIWKDRAAELPDAERERLVAKYDALHRRVLELRYHYHDRMLAVDAVLKPVILDIIANDPQRFAKLFARKIATLFDAFTATGASNIHTNSPATVIVALYFYPLLALAGIGILLSASHWRRYAPLVLLVAAWAVIHGVLTACTRFRLPIDPILFLLAATALARLSRSRTHRAG